MNEAVRAAVAVHSLLCSIEREWNHLSVAEEHMRKGLEIHKRSEKKQGWLLMPASVRAFIWMLWQRGESEKAAEFLNL
jgi:hypothetical protein